MSLRTKTLALVGLAITGLMTILYVTTRILLLGSFAHLEEEATRQDVQRALSAISQQLDELDTTVYDWAAWDDTYEFMADHNAGYVTSNLLDDTFVTLRLNLMLLVNPSGQITFAKAFDTHDEEAVPVPASVLDHLSETGLLRSGEETMSSIKGLLVLPDGVMITASRPILTSEDEGPMRGWLIMGRYLDSEEVERMAATTYLSLTMLPLDDPNLTDDFLEVQPSISEEMPIVVRPLSVDSIAGYTTVADIYGAPGLTLRVDTPRPIYRQGQSTITYFMASALLVSLVFGVLTFIALDRQVLRRVDRLSASVGKIRSHSDLSARVPVTGEDELSDLALEINKMLAALDHAQTDLKESEERFRKMADNIRDGLTIIEDGKVVYLNDRACEIFGYPRDQLARLTVTDLAASEERERLECVMAQARQTGVMPEELEFSIIQKDGTRRCVANKYTSSPQEDGTSRQYVISTDVTERRQVEKALKEHSRHLEDMVDERTKALQNAEEELTRMEKLALLGELAGGVSHELRNPLAVITNAIYFLRTMLTDADDTIAEYLEMITYEVNRAAKIVSDLLDFSRAKPTEREETSVSEFVSEALHRKRPPDGTAVETNIPSDLPPVYVDPQQMGLVMANLVANAFEAMPCGGALTITAWQENDHVTLSVADTGHGIAPEHITKIFEPLFTTKTHGIGLGLSLCKSLVEANEGIIQVESVVGNGSTFTLALPMRQL
jgi:PAS domain S-box-containing protein